MGIDFSRVAVKMCLEQARALGLTIDAILADLERFPLPTARYDLIVTFLSGETLDILGKNAADADALSTAVTVLGPQKGLELIESMPDTEAILVSPAPEYKITKSSAAEEYIE